MPVPRLTEVSALLISEEIPYRVDTKALALQLVDMAEMLAVPQADTAEL